MVSRFSPAQQRRKPFPWSATDCDILDLKCKRKAREARS
jgi:hypothetical protein